MKACTRCDNRFPDSATFCLFDGAPLAAPSDARLGTAVAGRYVLEEVIGEGGMATVYRARHKLVDAQFAVKIMNPLLARDPVVRERFRREATSAQKLAHPNIIEIFDQGDTERRHRLHGHGVPRRASRSPTIVTRGADPDRRAPSR